MHPSASLNDDQASGLRELNHNSPVQVIAVTAGKGGVGKSNVTVNLALALAQKNKRVMILDGDLGLANIDIMLGLHPKYNLSHVLSGERNLEEVIVEGPRGIHIVPASSGREVMTQLNTQQHAGLINAFSELSFGVDILLIDTAAGIAETVTSFAKAANEVLVVVCDEPTSITDAYALIKVLSRDHNVNKFHIVSNMVENITEGKKLFNKLLRVTDQFLDITLDHLGSIPYDTLLTKAVKSQQALIEVYPGSRSAQSISRIASDINQWPIDQHSSGSLCFFVERLVQSAEPS